MKRISIKRKPVIEFLSIATFTRHPEKTHLMVVEEYDGQEKEIPINFDCFQKFIRKTGVKTIPSEPLKKKVRFSDWFNEALLASSTHQTKWRTSETGRLLRISERLGHNADISTIIYKAAAKHA